jgi:hypothetical protein
MAGALHLPIFALPDVISGSTPPTHLVCFVLLLL